MWQPKIIPQVTKMFPSFFSILFFSWFQPKNTIPENLADIAGNYTKENTIFLYSENTFPSQMANFALLCMWCLLWIAWLSKIFLYHLKKLWHPFSQPSVQMNGDLQSTETKNRIRKYFSMPQLGTRKELIWKSHLRHQGLWEINNVQSQHAQLVPLEKWEKGWKRKKNLSPEKSWHLFMVLSIVNISEQTNRLMGLILGFLSRLLSTEGEKNEEHFMSMMLSGFFPTSMHKLGHGLLAKNIWFWSGVYFSIIHLWIMYFSCPPSSSCRTSHLLELKK